MKDEKQNNVEENVVDTCASYDILLADSGLIPKPHPNWKIFTPKLGDVAYVEEVKYVFDGASWVASEE